MSAKIQLGYQSQQMQSNPRAGYLPTLDGWRALAIVAVIFRHDRIFSVGVVGTGWLYNHGQYGVDLFFAISGLLICWRMLEEENLFGCISLRNFYIRRAFRILPPALAFLVIIGLLGLAGILPVGFRELLCSAFFLRNYSALIGKPEVDSYFTGHFWSLSIEEHFYLILPSLLVLTRKGWRIPVLVGLTLLIEIHRMRVLESRPWDRVQFHTGIRLDALLIPAVIAVFLQSSRVRRNMTQWLRFWPLLPIAILCLITYCEPSFWEVPVVALLMPLMILGTVLNPGGYLAKILEFAPLKYVGRISYSVYLWQELFIIAHYYGQFSLGILERTPLRFVATLAISMMSYHLLERPLLKLGHRLAPPATPGRDDAPPSRLLTPGACS